MMEEFGFRKEQSVGVYLDPFSGFAEKESSFEIRHDPITGVTCRILPYRFKIAVAPDIASYLEKSPDAICPFCPALFDQMTPRFTPDIIAGGRFQRGDAVLFPNAFPYDGNNGVALFSHRHFIGLDEMTPDVMRDGFYVCLDYFGTMARYDTSLRFCSINWNYMPPAGGGLIHPHIQTLAGRAPTRFVKTLYESARRYGRERGGDLWGAFVRGETETKERFIGETGRVVWLTSFAPRGMAGEVIFLFRERHSIFGVSADDLEAFLAGLARIFRYYHENNYFSFNMSLYATLADDEYFTVQGRLMPRFLIPPLGTSDSNYFEKFHDEIICPTVPEELCVDMRRYFNEGRQT